MNRCHFCHGRRFTLVKIQENSWKIQKCRTCSLVQVVPTPTEKEVNALYFRDWGHFAPYQSQMETHRQYFQTLLSYLFSRAGNKHHMRVLDVGCATGIFLDLLHRKKIGAVGIDVSRDAISYCTKHKYTAFYGTLPEVAKKKKWSNAFSILSACQVIEHERDPVAFLHAAYQVLKPGGILLVTTPNFNTFWRRIMGSYWIGYKHPEHLFFFTPKTVAAVLASIGFSVEVMRPDFSRPYSVSYAFRRLSDYLPVFSPVFNVFKDVTKNMHVSIPFNPWGDMLIIGRKPLSTKSYYISDARACQI